MTDERANDSAPIEAAHVDSGGRVHNVILVTPEELMRIGIPAHLIPLSPGHTVGIDWHTPDGGTTWVDKRGQWETRSVVAPFTHPIDARA